MLVTLPTTAHVEQNNDPLDKSESNGQHVVCIVNTYTVSKCCIVT